MLSLGQADHHQVRDDRAARVHAWSTSTRRTTSRSCTSRARVPAPPVGAEAPSWDRRRGGRIPGGGPLTWPRLGPRADPGRRRPGRAVVRCTCSRLVRPGDSGGALLGFDGESSVVFANAQDDDQTITLTEAEVRAAINATRNATDGLLRPLPGPLSRSDSVGSSVAASPEAWRRTPGSLHAGSARLRCSSYWYSPRDEVPDPRELWPAPSGPPPCRCRTGRGGSSSAWRTGCRRVAAPSAAPPWLFQRAVGGVQRRHRPRSRSPRCRRRPAGCRPRAQQVPTPPGPVLGRSRSGRGGTWKPKA